MMVSCRLTLQRPFCMFEVIRLSKCESCIVLWGWLRKGEEDVYERKKETGFWQPFIYFITLEDTLQHTLYPAYVTSTKVETRKKVG